MIMMQNYHVIAVAHNRWKQPRRNRRRPALPLARELIALASPGPDDGRGQRLCLVALAPQTGVLLGAIVVATADHRFCDHHAEARWHLLHLSTMGGLAAGEQGAVRQHLAVALLEQALAAGVCSCGLHARPDDLPELLAVGWELRPLGLAAAGSIAPFCVAVSRANLARLRCLVAETASPEAMAGQHIGGEVALAS